MGKYISDMVEIKVDMNLVQINLLEKRAYNFFARIFIIERFLPSSSNMSCLVPWNPNDWIGRVVVILERYGIVDLSKHQLIHPCGSIFTDVICNSQNGLHVLHLSILIFPM